MEDSNSYWSVRGSTQALCHRGTPVKCGQNIRLTHVNTGRNLHSHYFTSPLSSNQVLHFFMVSLKNTTWDIIYFFYLILHDDELLTRTWVHNTKKIIVFSCDLRAYSKSFHFQEVSAFGENGEGDNLDEWTVLCGGSVWKREESVRFRHTATEALLSVTGEQYGRPIHGQREVHGMMISSPHSYWRTMEGIFMKPSETGSRDFSSPLHTEF